jgi:NCS1 family nucleobase:cation symporter-1
MYDFHGMYRYSARYGTNWRSVVALFMGFLPPLPGFINSVSLNTIHMADGGKHL